MIRRLSKIIGQLVIRLDDAERKIANFERPGKVIDTDYKNGLVKVKVGDLESHWVPWRMRAGVQRDWDPPAKDEQVVLRSPSGEPGQGYVDHGGYSDKYPQNHDKGGEKKYQIGDAYIHMTGDKIVLKAGQIALDGNVTVGGQPGEGVKCAMLGTVTTDGASCISNLATRVKVV